MNKAEFEIINKKLGNIVTEVLPDNEIKKFITTGSKKVRSALALGYIKANNKLPDEMTYNILTAGELIHNASLLHDDVIDSSELRRGEATIWKKYSPNVSILCGDYLVSEAITLLMDINNNTISDIFNRCVRNMTVAEIKQFFLREQLPSFDEYIKICKGKTAGLFSAVLSGCALHLGMDSEHASEFGEKFGISFQIKNDFTEYSITEDKKNHIHTAVDILGIENTNILLDNYKQELRELIRSFPDNEGKSDLEAIVNGL